MSETENRSKSPISENKETKGKSDTTKLKDASEAIHDVKNIVETAKSIHETLGNPLTKGFGFLSSKIGKRTNNTTCEKNSFVGNEDSKSIQEDVESQSIKVTEQKTLIEPTTRDASTEIVVNDKDDPFTQLESILSPTNIGETHEKALAKAIEAQLKVLSVVKTPTLLSSCYNTILAALNDSITLVRTEEEKENHRRNAGLMLHSLVFFQEAQLSYEEKNHDKESEELLNIAANELQESVTSVALAAIPYVGQGAVVKKIVMKVAIEKACSGIKNTNFMARFLQFLFKKKNLEQQRKDFYTFLISAFDKLNRYKKNFGTNQFILAEMIRDYKDKIIPYAGDKTNELKFLAKDDEKIWSNRPQCSAEPGNGFTLKLLIILLTIGAIIGIDGYLIQNYYDQSPALITLIALAICFVMLVFDIVASRRINRSVKRAKRKYAAYKKEFQKEYADYYYSKLADQFIII